MSTSPTAQPGGEPSAPPATLQRLLKLRQYQQSGMRAPHKPLLVMLALTRLLTTGTSALTWLEARRELTALITEFGPTSKTSPVQAAAYPFTRLRSDGFWMLTPDVPMDRVTPLQEQAVVGQLEQHLQVWLLAHPHIALQAVHELTVTNFAPHRRPRRPGRPRPGPRHPGPAQHRRRPARRARRARWRRRGRRLLGRCRDAAGR